MLLFCMECHEIRHMFMAQTLKGAAEMVLKQAIIQRFRKMPFASPAEQQLKVFVLEDGTRYAIISAAEAATKI